MTFTTQTRKKYVSIENTLGASTVKPRDFCGRWFNATPRDEQERGYRAKCVQLLSRILKVQAETISQKWGSGIDFDGMPPQYEVTLAYADTLRSILITVNKNQDFVELVSECLKSGM